LKDTTKLPNVFVWPIEPLDSRYSEQWYKEIPLRLQEMVGNKATVIQLDGVQNTTSTSSGAFLNFSDTNRWKSTQLVEFLNKHDAGETTPNDVHLFTDAWNPVILQVKYMNDLMGYNWNLQAIWHAGSYDPTDILGYKMSKPWPWLAEQALFHACDENWYATDFHKQMFLKNLGISSEYHSKAKTSGQPHNLVVEHMHNIMQESRERKQGVIWPHRYNPDKQPEIAEDLSNSMKHPWCITQKMNLDKGSYYKKLAESQVIFSCSLHENLGISVMEAVLADVIPVLPNRCSYSEMYHPDFLYPSQWTQSWDNYQTHKQQLLEFIQHRLNHPKKFSRQLEKQKKVLLQRYLSADVMFENIINAVARSTQVK
jgi:hypothetical protein